MEGVIWIWRLKNTLENSDKKGLLGLKFVPFQKNNKLFMTGQINSKRSWQSFATIGSLATVNLNKSCRQLNDLQLFRICIGSIQTDPPYEQLCLFTLMKRRCGVWQGLSKCWFHLQNEIKTRWGDSKNEIGFDVHHAYEQNEIKTRALIMEQCQNLRNEIKTRWGESVNLPYWGHRTNKSRRSYIGVDELHVFWMRYGGFPLLDPPVLQPPDILHGPPQFRSCIGPSQLFSCFPVVQSLGPWQLLTLLGKCNSCYSASVRIKKRHEKQQFGNRSVSYNIFPTSCKVDMLCFNDRPKTHDWKDT